MTQAPNLTKVTKQGKTLGSDYKTQKRDRRREEILDAATIVFGQKGFYNSTLKNIADHLGVLPAALYHYVDSKEAALIEVCRRSGKIFNQSMREYLADHRPATVVLREAIRRHMQNNGRELVYSFAFQPQGLPTESVQELAEMAQEYQLLWQKLLDRAVQTGDLVASTDSRLSAIAILAMMNGSINYYSGKTVDEINRIADYFADMLL